MRLTDFKVLTFDCYFHDHEPARRFGLATAWIDRRHEDDGWGATMPPGERPAVDFHFNSLSDFVAAHKEALG
ncbi:MAG: hypothetical protein MI920_04340 [Kiloniellales bacterium]|nr:hypothetical protein [Kiloniellales bacterium]